MPRMLLFSIQRWLYITDSMLKLPYDMHLHSCLSPCGDDDMTPATIAGMATIIGLQVIALTDHNTCRNCPAFAAAANQYGITAICGMELTTSEEVHVLCYFYTLEEALSFDAYVHEHILPIPNKPDIFGNQNICDENDQVIGTEDILLISATDISISDIPALMEQFHGIMVPAHINKSSTSILSNLGFIPPDSTFVCAEVKNPQDIPMLKKQHPYLQSCKILSSSDAHTLNDIQEPIRFLEVEENSVKAILDMISGK